MKRCIMGYMKFPPPLYVCISPHLPRFQVWPSKSRFFCSQSIDSERKQKNIQATTKVLREKFKSWDNSYFVKKATFLQAKSKNVKNSRELRRYVSQNISSNSWNSTVNRSQALLYLFINKLLQSLRALLESVTRFVLLW